MKIHVIKPTKQEKERLRVCAYCRVSTDHDDQEGSLDNQIAYYEESIKNNPKYEYVNVYYDFGISGFKEKRPGFQKMMRDARAGKIDLIITKSLTRFARNTYTILKAIRELKELDVGIFFELQNIDTRTESGELMITILSAFAQGESESYSQNGKMVYRRKYEAGIPVHYLDRSFGYKKDENGRFVPDENQAPWVKKIFELAADGYDLGEIARYLNKNNVKTDLGADFTASTVKRILENEIYRGDYIMHKYYVNADRKVVKNRGEEDAWIIENEHLPIVSRKLWQKANDARNKKRDYLSTGSVVEELTEENYPYMGRIFCAECGYPLYRRVYSNGNRVCWDCSGKKRYRGNFCKGINVPDDVFRAWGDFDGNIYVREETDAIGKRGFKYVKESTWMRTHKKKSAPKAPELNDENYPYKDRIFCAKCGSRLTRIVGANNKVTWLCDGYKHKGKDFCSGIRIPDTVIWEFGEIKEDIYIERSDYDGKKCYTYSSKQNKDKAGE